MKNNNNISNERLLNELEVDYQKGLSSEEALKRLQRDGKNAIEQTRKTWWQKMAPYYWGPIPWIIEVAIVLSLFSGDIKDFIVITSLLLFNSFIGWRQDKSAQDALEALKNDLALRANVMRDGEWSDIDAAELVCGDIISIKLGGIVPADCQILQGEYLEVDQSALTGESMPVTKKCGDALYSGSIAKKGSIKAVVNATGLNTYFGKTAKLVGKAGAKSHLSEQLSQIGNFLIIGALILSSILVCVELFVYNMTPLEVIRIVLVLLVATIPVAMPAVISVTIALGALVLSRMKAIVSKLNSIEALASVDVLCSDKTGTLTQNLLSVVDVIPASDYTREQIISYACMASEKGSKDVIDRAIFAAQCEATEDYSLTKFVPFDPVAKMAQSVVDYQGKTMRVAKGATQVISKLCQLEGSALNELNESVNALAQRGYKALGLAIGDESQWHYAGTISLADPLRPDSKSTIANLEAEGIAVKLITGDSQNIAKEVAGELSIGTNILLAKDVFSDTENAAITPEMRAMVESSNGFAEVFPQHKYEIVKTLQEAGHICAMTGDGVNDSPALKQADCGIAVSGATDAARAAAALILTDTGLGVIENAIAEAKRIFARMMSYIYYRVSMTVSIMTLAVIVTTLGSIILERVVPEHGVSFFPLTAIMLVTLALLDDIPIMAIAYDNTRISAKPSVWNPRRVFTISLIMGGLSVIQSLGLLLWVDRSWMDITNYGQLQTIVFLQLVVGGSLLLFVTRQTRWFFSSPGPNLKLLLAILATQVLVFIMVHFGFLVDAIALKEIGFVWAYNLIWMFPLSGAAVLLHRHYDKKS